MSWRYLISFLCLIMSVYSDEKRCSCSMKGGQLRVRCNPFDRREVESCFKEHNNTTYLDFSDSGLAEIPKEIKILKNLLTLKLSNNSITEISHLNKVSTTLDFLQLDRNEIRVLKAKSLNRLKKMSHIDLSRNKIDTIENGTFNNHLESLRDLQLPFNNLTSMDTSWIYLPQARLNVTININATNNSISYFTNSIGVTIDDINIGMSIGITLLHNNFTIIDYKKYAELFNVTSVFQILQTENCGIDLRFNPFICDCRMYVPAMFIKDYKDIAHDPDNPIFDLRCYTPKSLRASVLHQVDPNDFNCTVRKGCPKHCSCVHTEHNNISTVKCINDKVDALPDKIPLGNETHLKIRSQNLRKITSQKYLMNLTSLDLSDCSIHSIHSPALPKLPFIKTVDLHDNALTELPKEIQTLNLTHLEHLVLYGNPFVCDCHSVWFKRWLIRNSGHIDLVDNIRCSGGAGSGKSVISVPDSDFTCPLPIWIVLIINFSVLLLLILVVILLYFQRFMIQVLLIHHFNCNWFRKKIKSNANFDVFVSHSGEDENYVMDILIPKLESSDPPYTVCRYEKHFVPGTPIIDNINRCISESLATVLVVSNNFLRSKWCRHEFRKAHSEALGDKNAIVIIILLEELDETLSVLEDDLKLYLKTNVYLKVNDRYFWSKLLKVLPLRSHVFVQRDVNETSRLLPNEQS